MRRRCAAQKRLRRGCWEPNRDRRLARYASGVMLRCEECREEPRAEEEALSWRAYVIVVKEGEPPEVVVYCPDCAEREFGDDDDLRNLSSRR